MSDNEEAGKECDSEEDGNESKVLKLNLVDLAGTRMRVCACVCTCTFVSVQCAVYMRIFVCACMFMASIARSLGLRIVL